MAELSYNTDWLVAQLSLITIEFAIGLVLVSVWFRFLVLAKVIFMILVLPGISVNLV